MFSANKATRSNYYKYLARLYYEAAIGADDRIGKLPGYEAAAPAQVMSNCAHCIELCLKSYLLDQGMDEKLVRKLKHGLMDLWNACVEHGAPQSEMNYTVLEIMANLNDYHRLRYGDRSRLGQVPVFGPLCEVCEFTLSLCGAPALSDLNPH